MLAAGAAALVAVGWGLLPASPRANTDTARIETAPPVPAPIATPAATPDAALASAASAAAPAAASAALVAAEIAPPAAPARPPRPSAARQKAVAGTTPVPAPAQATTTGSVQIAISPWGQVEVNGSAAGTTPPLTTLTLPEGSHTITVRNADFAPYTTTVQVTADKPAIVRHRFGS